MANITSKDYFYLDGVLCETVGLYCDTPPVQVMAEKRGTRYQAGSDEDLYAGDDSYADIQFKFTCFSFFPYNFNTASVYAYLQGKKELVISRNEGYYYKIRSVSCSASESADGNRIKYSITFKCSPFRYIADELDVIISGSGVVTNNGTRYSKPVYTITLSDTHGTGTISVNGQTVTIDIPHDKLIGNKTIIIDAEREMAYRTSGENETMYTSGVFRYLTPGDNTISLGGICSSVVVKRNGRCY